jgi:multidrug efflux pump subunit AcrA (membrane-fusion protein)
MTTRVKRRGRSWLAAVVVTLLAGWSVSGCSKSEAGNPTPKTVAPLPIAVRTVLVETRVLPRALDVTGTLNADAQTDVAAETAARAVRVNVERGQVVEAGAVLAQLDQQDALNQLHEAEAVERRRRRSWGSRPTRPSTRCRRRKCARRA